MNVRAVASHARPSERYPDTSELDISLEVGTERQPILLLVGQVEVTRHADGRVELYGGDDAKVSTWASAALVEDLKCLPTSLLARALIELERAALDACQGTRL